MLNADPLDDFEQGLAQPLAVVSVAKSREADQSALDFPLRGCRFLDPMGRDREITVGVAGLPSVAC